MAAYLILVCVSTLLFIVYNTVACCEFGVPSSMSNTYYLYERKKKGLGWLFTVFMWLLAFTMAPAWISVSDAVGPWMNNFAFLSFISIAGIAFVGTAPRFRDELEGTVHMTAAKICAVSALLWDFVVCWNIWYVPICGMIVPAIFATATKTWKSGRDYWLEMMAFGATFLTIIIETIIQMVIKSL